MTQFNPPPPLPPSLGVLDYSNQADLAWFPLVRLIAGFVTIACGARIVSGAGSIGTYISYNRGLGFFATSLLTGVVPSMVVYLLWGIGAIGCYSRAPWGRTMTVVMGWIVASFGGVQSLIFLGTMATRGFGPPSFASRTLYMLGQGVSSLGGAVSGAVLPVLVAILLSRPAARAVFGLR